MNAPDDLRYAKSHEWIRLEGETGTVGISDHAQEELTDIVYVELPKIGLEVKAGETVCVVESVKAASDIYAPVAGTVVEANEALSANPALVNTDAFGAGWLFKLRVTSPDEISSLLTAEQYQAQIGR